MILILCCCEAATQLCLKKKHALESGVTKKTAGLYIKYYYNLPLAACSSEVQILEACDCPSLPPCGEQRPQSDPVFHTLFL
ncbi:hypothetical protein GOP47_0014889 [Adiantum capillus-veneris]|uniref:Uncharacterized protein n=1 Tax=Adiantum capillus-veneris TaxID=13818 RepID=A0A9D4UN31_ADICA|nr:hypothetical protein GOP47_0014889 [Adiantum capillus-veneris]